MRKISDLTKDTRPTLENLLIEAIQDTVKHDLKRENDNGYSVQKENETFYYRAMYLFMQRSILYYKQEEVELWTKTELLKEVILPKIKDFDLSSQ